MSICRIYCDEIPTSVSKCEALQPQVIRAHENIDKKLRLVAIHTCGENEESYNYYQVFVNRTSANTYELVETTPTYTFKVINSKSGDVEQTGYGTLSSNGTLFTITVNGLNKGFYKLEVTTSINSYTSVCVFPILVCS